MNKLEVFIAGDFYGGNRVAELIDKEEYQTIFQPLLKTIQDADISVVNLESPLFSSNLKPILKTGPCLKAKINVLDALKYAGFNLLTLANNHILDFGEEGLNVTVDSINKKEIEYIGVGKNRKDSRKVKYIIKKQKTVAFLNFCESEWSIAELKKAGANPLNIIDNYHDINEAKKNADFVVVILHGGIEYSKYPSLEFKKICRFLIEAGADSVICHHTHIVSGYEVYQDKPIFFGIGNFIFDNKKNKNSDWNIGFAVKICLDKKITFEILPFKQCSEIACISDLNENEKKVFNQNISDINLIIQNDKLLFQKFNDWSLKKEQMYFGFLQPYSNRYLKGLFRRNILPSFLNKSFCRLILNLIRCESHREVLIKVLENKINENSDSI
jgi:poly-gamma-glutamate synthesis protein (capsule biosynthesis protein)